MAKKTTKRSSVPAKTYTAAEMKTNWNAAIAELLDRRKGMVSNVLQYRYDTGLLGLAIVEDSTRGEGRQKYGQHVVDDLAAAIDCSSKTVYDSMRFARMFTPAQLQSMKKKEWPWRQVQHLLAVEDPADRDQFQREFEGGDHRKGNELRQAVKEHNDEKRASGERKDNRGKRSGFMEAAKTAAASVTHATGEILPTFIRALKEFSEHSEELDDRHQEKFTGFATTVKKVLPATKRLISDVEKSLKAAGL